MSLMQRLGLGLLGWKLAASWSPQEELLFAVGMLERCRLFAHMQPRYLPRRRCVRCRRLLGLCADTNCV